MIPPTGASIEILRLPHQGNAPVSPFRLGDCALKFFLALLLIGSLFLPERIWANPLERDAVRLSSPEADEPVQLNADRLEFRREEDLFIAEGSVVVIQGPLRIEADLITLENRTGRLIALGNVRFTDGEDSIDAARVEININTQLGVLHNARIFIEVENYHIAADKMERRSPELYLLDDASFTACDCPEHPDWRLRARRIRLRIESYLVARDLVFYANEIPIFYLPYLVYPVKTERQTGLLIPHIGYSSRDGFRYNQDFFWAISPSQDATINLDHRGSRGDGGGVEYRYVLSRESHGILETHYFHDREDQIGQWEVRYNHQQRFSDRISAKIDVHYVNQQDYFQVVTDETADRARQNVESNLFVTYRGDQSFAYLLARYTIDLTSPSNSATPQRLPEIGYSLPAYRIGASPIYFHFESTAVNFWRSEGFQLQRADLYPKLSLPIDLSAAGTLTPWAGVRETWYSRGVVGEEGIRREVFPSGVHWEGAYGRNWGATTHLLSPSIMYEYIPVTDHPDLPQLDELDQLRDRNAVTASLAQRFLRRNAAGIMEEWIYLRLTETYNLREARADPPEPRPFSDLRMEGHVRFSPHVSIGIDAFYDFYDRSISFWNTELAFDLPPYLTLALGQRYTRGETLPQRGDLFNPLYLGDREAAPRVQFWTERIVIRTPWGIHLASRAFFDAETSKFVEIAYGLQYEEQCWGITLTYQDLHDRNEFSFMVNLKGLGATGSRKFASLF